MSRTIEHNRIPSVNGDTQLIQQVQKLREAHEQLRNEVGKVIVGQTDVVDLLLLGLLCRGHVL